MQSRLKNPGINPAKLTPPCLREQIQAMLKVFRAVVDKVVREKNAATKTISEGGVPRSGSIVRQLRVAEAVEEAPLRKSPLSRRVAVVKGPAEAALHQSPRTPTVALARREKKPFEKQPEAAREKPRVQGAAELMKQREKIEAELLKITDQLEHAELSLAMRETKRQELARIEQAKWEEFAGIQQSKQGMVLDDASKKVVDTRLRSLMEDAVAVSTTLATLVPEIKHLTTTAANLRAQLLPLQDSINNISTKIDVLVVQESCIRPHQFYLAFPVNREEMVPLKTHLPCAECGRYWADMALVNLPCGCLLHPICLFQVVLSSKPCCPGCNVKPSGGWMGQWGFKSDRASTEAAAAAVDKEGWAPPLSRTEAKIQNTKRKIEAPSTWLSSPKRACLPVQKAIAPNVEAAGQLEAAANITASVNVHVVNVVATPCDLIVHTKLDVEVGDDVASDTTVVAACGQIGVVAANDTVKNAEPNVNDAGHHTATSGPTPPIDAGQELVVEISPETTPLEYGEILNIANAAATEADPTTPT